jgi:hypothetical protein
MAQPDFGAILWIYILVGLAIICGIAGLVFVFSHIRFVF